MRGFKATKELNCILGIMRHGTYTFRTENSLLTYIERFHIFMKLSFPEFGELWEYGIVSHLTAKFCVQPVRQQIFGFFQQCL